MNIAKSLLSSVLVITSLLWQPAAMAQTKAAAPAPAASASLPLVPGTQYSQKGADTCLYCHDADSDTATHTLALLAALFAFVLTTSAPAQTDARPTPARLARRWLRPY